MEMGAGGRRRLCSRSGRGRKHPGLTWGRPHPSVGCSAVEERRLRLHEQYPFVLFSLRAPLRR
jgi:hypothetical protein